jgi:hypothetical protein
VAAAATAADLFERRIAQEKPGFDPGFFVFEER